MASEIENTKIDHSPSNSQGSSTHPRPPSPSPVPSVQPSSPKKEEAVEEDFAAMDSGGSNKKEDFAAMNSGGSNKKDKPKMTHSHQCFTKEEISKFNKYEADFASYLRAKYFSDKDAYGSNIFDLKIPVGGEVIKASRHSPTRSFADPSSVPASGDKVPSASASGDKVPSASGVKRTANGNKAANRKNN